jgi:hypothetical protein
MSKQKMSNINLSQSDREELNFRQYKIIKEIDEKMEIIAKKFVCKNGQAYFYNGVHWTWCGSGNSKLEEMMTECGLENLYSINDENKFLKSLENNRIEFDKHKNLFCFNNKLYNIEEQNFVEPKPEYYITQTTGYDYSEPTEEQILKVKKIMSKWFPIVHERNVVLKLMKECIGGKQSDKTIVLCGSVYSGKSSFIRLFENMFGNYHHCIDDISIDSIWKLDARLATLCPSINICDTRLSCRTHGVIISDNDYNIAKLDKKTREKSIPIEFRNKFHHREHDLFQQEYDFVLKNCREALFHELIDL